MPISPPQLVAGGNINPSRFIKLSAVANNTALEADANERTIGVSQDGAKTFPGSGGSTLAAAAGDLFAYHAIGDVCRIQSGAAFDAGALLESDADGKAVTRVTTAATVRHIGALALEAAGGADEFVQVQLVCFTYTNPA